MVVEKNVLCVVAYICAQISKLSLKVTDKRDELYKQYGF